MNFNFAPQLQQLVNQIPQPARAICMGAALVVILYLIPPTKRFAVWVGVAILIFWGLSILKNPQQTLSSWQTAANNFSPQSGAN